MIREWGIGAGGREQGAGMATPQYHSTKKAGRMPTPQF
ncbi:hypothetical protein NSP_51020 [Nodularia spumigena CCY9414]|nr:hypothetical protein NSP_51020 [Nodularia spumigena CCY9414]EAW43498.1 hypothetical protein N9414_01914 [Nodularia spumigena CCY9414]